MNINHLIRADMCDALWRIRYRALSSGFFHAVKLMQRFETPDGNFTPASLYAGIGYPFGKSQRGLKKWVKQTS